MRANCIATRPALFAAALLLACASATAAPAGTVTQLSGLLLVQKADGRTKVVATGSAVDVGDTLFTGNRVYAQISLADRSLVILEPDTQLTLDDAKITLTQGGIEVTRGAIARPAVNGYAVVTGFGTLQATQSRFIVAYGSGAIPAIAAYGRIHLASNSALTMSDAPSPGLFLAQAASKAPSSQNLAPGLYVQVIDGAINLTNKGGSQNFSAGQFGYVPNFNQPPVVLPQNPGLHFTPPPTFNSSGPGNTGSGGKAVDCEVR